MHAYLVATSDERRWGALTFYCDDGWGGPEGRAYGLHRVSSERTFSRLAGFGALGRDFIVPFSCTPHNTGLQWDPAHPAADEEALHGALREMLPFGFTAMPSSHAEHFELLLRVAAGARGILEQARTGSRACGRTRVHPDTILKHAFPPWLTVGPLPTGLQARPLLGPSERHMPGADAQLLRTVARHGLQPIFVLLDTTEREASDRALQDVAFSHDGNDYSGHQFMRLVCSPQRLDIPGLRLEPPKALLSLPPLEELGVAIDPTEVDWLWHPRGLRVLEGHGRGLHLGFLLRSTGARHTGYVVLADLDNPDTRADVIAACELHFLSANDPARHGCIERVFHDYELHTLKSWRYKTRTWLRLAALLSNSPLVSVGRSHQARLLS
jgi:hypothetical protein